MGAFSSENVVAIRRVGQDDRQHDNGAYQQEGLRFRYGRGFAKGDLEGYQPGIHADAQANVVHQKDTLGKKEGPVFILVVQAAPEQHEHHHTGKRHDAEKVEIGQGPPEFPDSIVHQRHTEADQAHEKGHVSEKVPGALAGPILGDIFSLHDQPDRCQQSITADQGDTRHQAECVQPVKCTAGESPAGDLDALDIGAQHHPLGQGGHQ